MNTPETLALSKNKGEIFKLNQLILASLSLCALVITFLTASADYNFQIKIAVFFATVSLYLIGCAAFYFLQANRLNNAQQLTATEESRDVFSLEIETKLLALEEANQFFGASLKSADMFRLVSSRIREIIPFSSSALFLAVENNTRLRATFADGENSEALTQIQTDSNRGLAGRIFVNRKAEITEKVQLDASAMTFEALKSFNSAVGVPLYQDAEVFGVLMLYGKDARAFDQNSLLLLEAVGERVAPLFLNSFTFEKNLSNALTDSLTNLPNERAFYLVVENKIAESQRFRYERPLTILTIDIKEFSVFNKRFGHAVGDNMLAFVAKTIKEQLRAMDYMARAAGDEFLAVLPTADEETAKEIIGRIERAFVSHSFAVSRLEKITLSLNFGTATFWKDGETISQLLQHANLRRQQSKTVQKSKVLWFPKEYVN